MSSKYARKNQFVPKNLENPNKTKKFQVGTFLIKD